MTKKNRMTKKLHQNKQCPVETGVRGREETVLRRCSADQHGEGAKKKDAISNQQNTKTDTSKGGSEPSMTCPVQTLKPSKGSKPWDPRTTHMLKMLRKGRSVRRVLSSRAAKLHKSGMSVAGAIHKLGVRGAFSNWHDATSIPVTVKSGSGCRLMISRPRRAYQRKKTIREIEEELLRQGCRRVA